jgi:hypothetical protein
VTGRWQGSNEEAGSLFLGTAFFRGDGRKRRRYLPRPAEPTGMTAADIKAAATVLARKHQRGELSDDEYAVLDTALRREPRRPA